MKKKLKKQKDVAESQAAQIEELRGQVDELQLQTSIQVKAAQDQNERRLREMENTLSKAYTNLRNLDKQVNDLTQMKLDLEEEIRKREKRH